MNEQFLHEYFELTKDLYRVVNVAESEFDANKFQHILDQREQLIKQFNTTDQIKLSSKEIELIKKIKDLDAEIIEITQNNKDHLQDKLSRIRTNKKLQKSYGQNMYSGNDSYFFDKRK